MAVARTQAGALSRHAGVRVRVAVVVVAVGVGLAVVMQTTAMAINALLFTVELVTILSLHEPPALVS